MKKILRILFHMLPLSWQIRFKKEVSLLYENAGYGDTLMIGAVAREIKKKYGNVTVIVNRTRDELLYHNPYVDRTGGRYNGIDLNYHYGRGNAGSFFNRNILDVMCRKIGVPHPDHSVEIFLTEEEISFARQRVAAYPRPLITIQTASDTFDNGRKQWPFPYWEKLVSLMNPTMTVIHLGGSGETYVSGTVNLLGAQDIRRSIAIIKYADIHIGIVSSLMHGAAAVGTPSIILYGGFERYANHGYASVFPFESEIPCAPCLQAATLMEKCPFNIQCMRDISPESVYGKVIELTSRK